MKLNFFAALALSLTLLLGGCASNPASTQVGDAVTLPAKEEQPVYNDETVGLDESTDTPTETPAETPTPAEPADVPEVELSVTCTAQSRSGSFDEVCSYQLDMPTFAGLKTIDADKAVNEFYMDLGAQLESYVYDTVYKTAQENHVGADVQGSYSVVQADNSALIVEYSVTVSYDGEEKTTTRTDTFDPATGEVASSVSGEP